TFFYYLNEFKNWSKSLDPFHDGNPLLQNYSLKIFVNEIEESIVANNYVVCKNDENLDFGAVGHIPSFEEINLTVHISAKENFIIDAKKLFIINAVCTDTTAPFFILSAKSLSVCLASEFVNTQNVILRGIR